MRASLIAAIFAAAAAASPIAKRDLVVETKVNTVIHWVTETVDPSAPTPTPVFSSSAVEVAAVTPTAAPAPSVAPAPKQKAAAPAKQVSKPAPAAQADLSDYQNKVLLHHNVHRANHSAPDAEWDTDLEAAAKAVADSCVYAHNTDANGGGYGQNIAAGVTPDNIGSVISDLFYNGEVNYYTYYGSEPSMDNFENWGHFSQVVWKASTRVACYTTDCSAQGLANVGSDVPPYFTVCDYRDTGNVGGAYNDNIGSPLGNPTVDGSYSG